MKLNIKLVEGGQMPVKATPQATGYDCYARAVERSFAGGGLRKYTYPLGFCIEGHEGLDIQIRCRSSISKLNAFIPMGLGTIDADYRGEVCLVLFVFGDLPPYQIGDRCAQLVIGQLADCTIDLAENLSETHRGENGFGSTGK